MATIKVKNVSPRLFSNVGGQNLLPGQEIEIDAKFAADVKGVGGLEVAEVKAGKTEAKPAGWNAEATK